jgi:hypothetical protein
MFPAKGAYKEDVVTLYKPLNADAAFVSSSKTTSEGTWSIGAATSTNLVHPVSVKMMRNIYRRNISEVLFIDLKYSQRRFHDLLF